MLLLIISIIVKPNINPYFTKSYLLYEELSGDLKKKILRYLIGVVLMDLFLLFVTITDMQLIPGFGLILPYLNFLLIFGALLIYLGIIRKK